MSESSNILEAVSRAILAHSGTVLDLTDNTKIFYSLQDSGNWCKDESSLPCVVVIAESPSVVNMFIGSTTVEQTYTIYLYNRSTLSDDALSIDMAKYDHDVLTELRSIVNDIQHRQYSGVETTDLIVTDISQKHERNHSPVEDGTNTVSQYTTTFTIQYDEVY